MSGLRIEGDISGNIAEVDAAGNLKIALTNAPEYTGSVRLMSENDPGELTGTPSLRSPETSNDYRLRVGFDTIQFNDTFNGSTQNTSLWSYTFNTLTAAQPGAGTVNFSAVQGTTSAHGAFMRTFQYFPVFGTGPLALDISLGLFTAALVAGEVCLFGFGLPGGATTLPTDGAWLQIDNSGVKGVIVYNGVTTQTGVILPIGSVTIGELFHWTIVVAESVVQYWYEDKLMASLTVPAGNGQPFMQASLPIFLMKYNTGSVSNTNTFRVSDVCVTLMDLNTTKTWETSLAVSGKMGYVGQNGHTQGQTSVWTNNTAPTAVALTNTTAAFTGLGGITAVLPTLTANNDGILISYQNPVPSINITGRNLIIKGIKVHGVVTVALTGGAVLYSYAVAFGHTSVSLATTETASFATGTTHAPRRVPIGIESYAANAAVGVKGSESGIFMPFSAPIVVRPGEFIAIIARNMGVVTSAGAITITVSLDTAWE